MVEPRGRGGRSSRDLVDVAVRHYELGESIDALATERGVDQSTIRRWLARAKSEGIVRMLVVPPFTDEDRTALGQDVRYQFDLEDIVIVPGREDVSGNPAENASRETLIFSIALAAARYLENHLTNDDDLLVPWGRMANYVARQLRAPRPLPKLTVGPMEGVLGVEDDPFEANILASSIASKFGGRSLLLPAPAVVDPQLGNVIEKLPLVERVMSLYQQATAANVPLASPDPKRSTVVRTGLMSVDDVKELVARGAVGEIASHWWFDSQGRMVDQDHIHPIGLGLDGLTDMVRRRAKVIAVVGGSPERILPLKVALENKLVNILITDHITAQMLLSK